MGKAENAIESYLTEQFTSAGYLVWKFASPSMDGVPDRILIGPIGTFFVETKSPVGQLRTLQKTVIQNMIDHGAHVFTTYTKQQVDNLLNAVCSGDFRKAADLVPNTTLTRFEIPSTK